MFWLRRASLLWVCAASRSLISQRARSIGMGTRDFTLPGVVRPRGCLRSQFELANEDEIEQDEITEAGCTEKPVAACFWPPDPQKNGQEHGVGQSD